ncbi:MAG: site-specific integrase, partial [Acidobacteria bacterium]|nr:site-specific integrase [Acidobacteriota bacterium]
RRQHIEEWTAIFGNRRRSSIRPHEIRAQRDRWLTEPRTDAQGRRRPPYAPGSVNKRLRALSNLWRVLDGRHAPNPVREVPEADEIESEPRALPYPVIKALLEAMPDITRTQKGCTRTAGSRTRARLAVMAWTGLAQVQVARLRPEDIDWNQPSIWVRGRRKGAAGSERRGHRKPITAQAVAALRQFNALNCWGPFSAAAMRRSLRRACRKVEDQFRREGITINLNRVRPYDFRHSYATALLAATGDLQTTQRLMLHQSASTTERYARAAVDPMLVAALEQFTKHVTKS